MADDDPTKPGGRTEDDPTKPGGRTEDDPTKPGGRDGDDPTKPGGRGAGLATPFGSGAGWVVVAFISPVSMNIPELAARMLLGNSSPAQTTSSPQGKALAKTAVLAQKEARKQAAAARKQEAEHASDVADANAYRKLRQGKNKPR